MKRLKICMIGYGEVGSILSETLQKAGVEINIYTRAFEDPTRTDIIKKKLREEGYHYGTLKEVVQNSKYIFSTVTTNEAENVARNCTPYLQGGHYYIDLNSVSPNIKRSIQIIIEGTQATFIEGAILEAINISGSKTKILLSGRKAGDLSRLLLNNGMNVQFYSHDIGKASMFKMFRSIFTKGVEATLIEMLVAGKRVGIEEELWEDITNFMALSSFREIGANWIKTHAISHQRRYHELQEIIATMKERNIPPLVTNGVANVFKQSLDVNLKKKFRIKPDSYKDVINYIEEKVTSTHSK